MHKDNNMGKWKNERIKLDEILESKTCWSLTAVEITYLEKNKDDNLGKMEAKKESLMNMYIYDVAKPIESYGKYENK